MEPYGETKNFGADGFHWYFFQCVYTIWKNIEKCLIRYAREQLEKLTRNPRPLGISILGDKAPALSGVSRRGLINVWNFRPEMTPDPPDLYRSAGCRLSPPAALTFTYRPVFRETCYHGVPVGNSAQLAPSNASYARALPTRILSKKGSEIYLSWRG